MATIREQIASLEEEILKTQKNKATNAHIGNYGAVSTITNGMNFENGRAERAATVTSSQCGWDAIDWNVVSGNVDAPAGFDPGSWIGQPV